MGMVVMLFMLVLVVATTATVVTLVVLKAVAANTTRSQLPPPPRSHPHSLPRPPEPRFPLYPAHRLSAGDRERIMVLLRAGRKIHAIKLYREVTGAGLREAKDAVENLERYQ